MYVGQYMLDNIRGFGTLYYADRTIKYEGSWLNGLPHGNGTLTRPDGMKYVGGFINGNMDGSGSFFNRDGVQLNDLEYEGGANRVSLKQARINFKKNHVSDLQFSKQVRRARVTEL